MCSSVAFPGKVQNLLQGKLTMEVGASTSQLLSRYQGFRLDQPPIAFFLGRYSSGRYGLTTHAVRLLGPIHKVYVFHAGVSEASGKKIFPGRGCGFIKASCLENPRDGGAWWAAVYGVAQSRTRLKQRSGSSRNEWILGKRRNHWF